MAPRMLLDRQIGKVDPVARPVDSSVGAGDDLAAPTLGRPGGLSRREVRLAAMIVELGAADDPDETPTDAQLINRLHLMEQLKAAVAGAQAADTVRFAQSQVAAHLDVGVHPTAIGRGIADQIALACHLSPTVGSQRLTLARSLHFDLPESYALLRSGTISEWVATLISRETSHLKQVDRRLVDAQLATQDLGSLSPRQATPAAAARSWPTPSSNASPAKATLVT